MLYSLNPLPLCGFILPLPFGEFQANGSVLRDVLRGSHVCTRIKEGTPGIKEGLRACSFIQHVRHHTACWKTVIITETLLAPRPLSQRNTFGMSSLTGYFHPAKSFLYRHKIAFQRNILLTLANFYQVFLM